MQARRDPILAEIMAAPEAQEAVVTSVGAPLRTLMGERFDGKDTLGVVPATDPIVHPDGRRLAWTSPLPDELAAIVDALAP